MPSATAAGELVGATVAVATGVGEAGAGVELPVVLEPLHAQAKMAKARRATRSRFMIPSVSQCFQNE